MPQVKIMELIGHCELGLFYCGEQYGPDKLCRLGSEPCQITVDSLRA